jgi:SAM-dependent methyltransferase
MLRILELAEAGVLRCPDDSGQLRAGEDFATCEQCMRRFQLLDERTIELLPSRTESWQLGAEPYHDSYSRSLEERYVRGEKIAPWADPVSLSTDDLLRKASHARWISERIAAEGLPDDAILCDISAGPGYYSLALAPQFPYAFHCDLSARALSFAARQAEEAKVDNIFFVRLDYLRPPFASSVHRLICLDTLIRGRQHDVALLRAILKALRPDGMAVVDFHNWWHNPLRRLGFLKDNFVGNTSYTRSDVMTMIEESRAVAELEGYYQEAGASGLRGAVVKLALPRTRHTATIRRAQDSFAD